MSRREPINYHSVLAQAPLNKAGVGRYLRSAIKILVIGSKSKFTPSTDESDEQNLLR